MLKRTTQALSDCAAVAIAGIMLVTIADVIMKNTFHLPIKGAFEAVEFLMVCVVFLGLAEVFRSGANICVDIADHFIGARGLMALRVLGTIASVIFLSLMLWAMIDPAQDTLAFPQWTQELGIPLYAFWAPILAGTALSILAAAFGWTRAPQPHAIGE
jgi:TRAP-type C4-dicarboxylate transport system permease small subunit